MITHPNVRLARPEDAGAIALMSRDTIEAGLGWSWTPPRVRRAITDGRTNAVVVADDDALHGFAIMRYADEHAHLQLMAVDAAHRRRGIGSAMLRWLEDAARAAGAATIGVEARRSNDAARCFYNEHGFHEQAIVAAMYRSEDGLSLRKWLRASSGA